MGNPDRFTDGTNRVYMYDKHGVVVYEKKKGEKLTGTINELNIYFSVKESSVLTPHNLYSGNFTMEGINISKNSRWENISTALKSRGYKKKGDFSYVKNGTYIIFRFQDNGSLETLSIGKG